MKRGLVGVVHVQRLGEPNPHGSRFISSSARVRSCSCASAGAACATCAAAGRGATAIGAIRRGVAVDCNAAADHRKRRCPPVCGLKGAPAFLGRLPLEGLDAAGDDESAVDMRLRAVHAAPMLRAATEEARGSQAHRAVLAGVVAMVPAGVTLKGVELRPSRGPGARHGELVGMRRLVRGRPADFCGPL